jgi:hypothetical protein
LDEKEWHSNLDTTHTRNGKADSIEVKYGFPRINRFQNLDFLSKLAILELCSVLLFWLFLQLEQFPILTVARTLSGFLAFVMLPGYLLESLFLPERNRNIGMQIIIGFGINLIGVQIFFVITQILGIGILLVEWLLLSNMIIFYAIVGFLTVKNRLEIKEWGANLDREVLFLVGIALLIRILLSFYTLDIISPDASLYADYARGIIEGDFTSSISNDDAVHSLIGGAQYVTHQAFTYLFAVSWVLCPPGVSGPIFGLIAIGTAIVALGYEIARHVFGIKAARYVGFILAIHPTFVFHSVAAYGPEIVSLALLLGIMVILVNSHGLRPTHGFLAGILGGLVDEIWFTNFYIMAFILPVFLFVLRKITRQEAAGFQLALLLAVIARLLFQYPIFYLLSWIGILSLLLLYSWKMPSWWASVQAPFFIGILTTTIIWKLPIQISVILLDIRIIDSSSSLFAAILAPVSLQLLAQFALFIAFHITPVLLCMAILAILKKRNQKPMLSFLIPAALASFGTLKVFSLFQKEVLSSIYLFSDSRFFLFISAMFILSIGAFFNTPSFAEFSIKKSSAGFPKHLTIKQKRTVLVAGLVLIGLAPSYLSMPSGFRLIDIEDRYGWNGLPDILISIGNEETVFLVNRVREFSWFTNRKAAYLGFSEVGLGSYDASGELVSFTSNFGTDYVIIDGYTITKWRTLEYLLLEPIRLESSVMLKLSEVSNLRYDNDTSCASLTLIAETEPNDFGRLTRVYSFSNKSFVRQLDINLIDIGWNATNQGSIINNLDGTHIIIGDNHNSTSTQRSTGFDLNLALPTGFLLIDIEEVNASVSSIEIWDESGSLLRFAEDAIDELYIVHVSEITVGDIRIRIDGDAGESIIVRSISYWEAQ